MQKSMRCIHTDDEQEIPEARALYRPILVGSL